MAADARSIRNEIHLGGLETSFVKMRAGAGEVREATVAVTVIARRERISRCSPASSPNEVEECRCEVIRV